MFSGCHFCVLLFSISLHFLFRFLIARQIAQYAYNTLKDCKTDIFKVSTSFITYYVELSDFFPLHSSCSCLLVRCAVLRFFAVFNFSVTSTREKKRPFCYSMLRVYREKLHAVDIGTYKKRKKATHKTIYLWNCLCNFSFNVDFFLNVFALLMHCRLSCSKLARCVCAIPHTQTQCEHLNWIWSIWEYVRALSIHVGPFCRANARYKSTRKIVCFGAIPILCGGV